MDRRGALCIFVVAAFLAIAWSFAVPLVSGPDEAAHVVKAAGVVRGQFLGAEADAESPFGTRIMEDVPAELEQVHQMACYQFDRDSTADCAEYVELGGRADVTTTAGRHPPFYYAIVGVPTLVSATSGGMYGMRILSSLGTAAMLAMAWLCLGFTARPRVARLAFAVTVTPMMIYLGGTVNPNGWEIAAAVMAWSAGLVLAGGEIRATLVHALGAGAVVMVLVRQLGPLWLAVMAVVLALIAAGPVLRALLRRWDVRAWLVAIVGAVVAQVGWLVAAEPLSSASDAVQWTPLVDDPASWTRGEILLESISRTMDWFHQWIGVFGVIDVVPPRWTHLVWTAAILGVVVAGIVVARRRELIAGGLLVAAVLVIPVLAEQRGFYDAGLFWQGRYTMPIAVGVPLLAGVASARRVEVPGRLALVSGILLASAQVLAFAQAIRRYSAGARSERLLFWVDAPWSPPIPSPLLIAGFTIVLAAWYWLLLGPWAGRPAVDAAPTDLHDASTDHRMGGQ